MAPSPYLNHCLTPGYWHWSSAISWKVCKICSQKLSSKIKYLNIFMQCLPGDNDLINFPLISVPYQLTLIWPCQQDSWTPPQKHHLNSRRHWLKGTFLLPTTRAMLVPPLTTRATHQSKLYQPVKAHQHEMPSMHSCLKQNQLPKQSHHSNHPVFHQK